MNQYSSLQLSYHQVFLVFFIFCRFQSVSCLEHGCHEDNCTNIVDIAIINKLRASLKAELDISTLNRHIIKLVKKEVEKECQRLNVEWTQEHPRSTGLKIINERKKCVFYLKHLIYASNSRTRRGFDRMVVGFTTTYATSAFHHYSCEFESRSWRGVLDTKLCDKVCQ